MKIAVTASGPERDADIDPRFGRCPWFALIDSESGATETLANPFVDAVGGSGTQAAQWLLDHGVQILVTGRCGPKATAVLEDAGIRIIEGASGKVREAVERLGKSEVPRPSAQVPPGRWPGVGPGMGRGAGQGGSGRGAGRGRGRGLGGGRGGQG